MATLKIGNYKIHPICAEVPDPTDEEYAAMAESMKARGIQKPILIWGAEVVSGKTRVRIGVEFGLKIPELKWHPKSSGKDAVEREIRTLLMDEDYNRRHLTTGQRAMFAAPLVTTEGFKRPNRITTEYSVVTQEDAAKSAGVSPDAIQQASAVIEHGTPKLQEAVREGEVSVSDAAKIVDLPKSEQNAAVKAVEKGEAKTVSAAAGKKGKPRPPKQEPPLPIRERPTEDSDEPMTAAGKLTDQDGHEVPLSLREAFARRKTLKGLVSDIGKVLNMLESSRDQPGGERLPMTEIRTDCRNLQSAIKAGMPHAICPYCKGKKCAKCEHGWLTKEQYAGIPDERRQKK